MPGKIVKIENGIATVDYEAEQREARLIDDDFKVGDYVFVQAKLVIQKIPEKEASLALEGWKKVMKDGS